MKQSLTKLVFFSLLCFCFAGCRMSAVSPAQEGTKEGMTLHSGRQDELPSKEPELLGYAETKILDDDEERLENIRLAAKTINDYVLEPDQIFSFNNVVGERTPQKGYEDAPVIIDHQKEEGCGGGVCQLSTTIYQAAKSAGLFILERHDHQKNVGYAPQGEDASVDYGNLDMKFQNNKGTRLQIKTSLGDNVVTAAVYGLPD